MQKNTSNSTLSTLDDVGKQFKNSVDALNTFKKESKDWEKKGGLTDMAKILDSESLSKLSSSLGVIGATFGIISLFTGGESDTDKILDAISKVNSNINSLTDLMVDKFDHLENLIEEEFLKQDIRDASSHILSLALRTNQFLVAKNDGLRREAIKKLKSYTSSDIDISSLRLGMIINGQGNYEESIFGVTSKSSYGDIGQINRIGHNLLFYLEVAIILDVFISTILDVPENDLLSLPGILNEDGLLYEDHDFSDLKIPKHIAESVMSKLKTTLDFYQPILQNLGENWKKAINNCEQNVKSYMNKYLNTEIFSSLKVEDGVAKSVREKLDKKYQWLDFLVIIYDNITGYNKHYIRGKNHESNHYFHQQIHNSEMANIVVAFSEKDDEFKIGNISTEVKMISFDGRHYEFYPTEDRYWDDLRDMDAYFTDENCKPAAHRMLWSCANEKNIHHSKTNENRLIWKKGDENTIAIFE